MDFRYALNRYVTPRLSALGYEYEENLRDRDVRHGYLKHLGDNVRALIMFQRHEYRGRPIGCEFTINLVRCKTADVSLWYLGGYEGFLQARLSLVLWFVYKVRDYGQQDHWWIATKDSDIEPQLRDALDRLTTYGIPWLENPQSRDPLFIPDERVAEFRQAMSRIAVPQLAVLGYQPYDCPDQTTFCFNHELPHGFRAAVDFILGGAPDGEKLMLHVELSRARSDPGAVSASPRYPDLHLPFSLLLWRKTGVNPAQDERVQWKYGSAAELDRQLVELVRRISQYAIPWLADPDSTNAR